MKHLQTKHLRMTKTFIAAVVLILLIITTILTAGCTTTTQTTTTQNAAAQNAAIENALQEIIPTITQHLSEPVNLTVKGETDLPGNFYLSFVYNRQLFLLDGKGNIIWSKHENQTTDKLTGLWDFKKHVINNKTYYSYHDYTGTYDNYNVMGFGPGERVILDENFNEIKRITFEESSVTEKGHPVDGHDFLMITPDHYILSGYIKGTVTNVPGYPQGSSVLYSYLQEVENGKVIWDWKSIDYPELYSFTVTDGSPTATDYANEKTDAPDIIHFNSMRLDKDGNLICSFRHICSILCLDRTKQTDQIKWILSGIGDEFGLDETQKTSCQHYALIKQDPDNENIITISAFDNGNKNKSTRLVTYRLDKDSMKLKDFTSHSIGEKFSMACGSVQNIKDEIYVIGWGWATKDTECMSVYDFATGKELLSVDAGLPLDFTYRCVYYD